MTEGKPDAAPGEEYVTRTDFFGGKHYYKRDVDGLYTPPAYCYDVLNSKYASVVQDGLPTACLDTDTSKDGTKKFFEHIENTPETAPRYCQKIEDRFGNATTINYLLTN
jgi:hypothetical protein